MSLSGRAAKISAEEPRWRAHLYPSLADLQINNTSPIEISGEQCSPTVVSTRQRKRSNVIWQAENLDGNSKESKNTLDGDFKNQLGREAIKVWSRIGIGLDKAWSQFLTNADKIEWVTINAIHYICVYIHQKNHLQAVK